MKYLIAIALFLSAFVGIATFTTSASSSKKHGDVLIANVSLIDVRNGKVIPGQYILLKGDLIAEVNSNEKSLEGTIRIDGTGKYIIPGLWDMHTHNWWDKHFSNYYVANGVLGVRNMYTPMSMITPVKDSINRNLIYGPYYVAAGRVLEGREPEFPDWLVVDTKEKIKPALDTLQMEGSDFVKVYNKIPAEVYFELVKEAHKRGMRVEGHVPLSISAIDASNAGQRSIEHLLGIPDVCTKDTLFKNRYKNNWFAAVMKEDDYATVVIDSNLTSKNFAILKKNNTYVCPTLVVWQNYFHPDIPFEDDLNVAKFPSDMNGFWSGEIAKYRKKDSVYKNTALKKFETFKRVTYLLYKHGVPLLTGTDAINPYCMPGYSLHRELQLLRDCGIPDAHVLKMATITATEFLGISDRYGEIKKGYRAWVVLLSANPLLDITNTTKIETVIVKGRVIDKHQLDILNQ